MIADVCYLAGIIDGEGCFAIRKMKCYKKHRCNCPLRYQCSLTITNTDKNFLDQLQCRWGGFIFKNRIKNVKWSQSYRLIFTDTATVKLIQITLPYLIIKRKQAELILEYRKTFKNKMVDSREIYFQQLHVLNTRGV